MFYASTAKLHYTTGSQSHETDIVFTINFFKNHTEAQVMFYTVQDTVEAFG